MPCAVRAREGAHRDRQRLERRRPAIARRLTCDHARHVGLERHLDNRIVAPRLREAHTDGNGFGVRRSAFGVLVLAVLVLLVLFLLVLRRNLRTTGREPRTPNHEPRTENENENENENAERRTPNADRPHSSSPRNARMSVHIRGRLAISWWSSSTSDSVTLARLFAKASTVR